MPFVSLGMGVPLLLVHGSLCDYRYWAPQFHALGSGYTCIAPSLTHYWPNPRQPHDTPFHWQRHVDQLRDFIGECCAGQAHVVGHSRGGFLAYQLAATAPEMVLSLTLADPAGSVWSPDRSTVELPAAVLALRQQAAQLITANECDAGLRLFVDSVSRPGSWDKSPVAFKRMAMDNAHTLALQFADPLPPYEPGLAAAVKCRTLLIDGQRSPRIFRINVDALAQWIPGAQRTTMGGVSHGMNTAHPSAFNRLVVDFVRDAAGV